VNFGLVVAIPSIVQYCPTLPLAVKRPAGVMLPQDVIQETGALALNCCVCPWGVVAATGVMVIGETTFTLAVALPLPSVAFAVMVHNFG